MTAPVYLDYNATTPVAEPVLEAMLPYFRTHHANASSQHSAGRLARQAVDRAREQVAAAVDAHPSEVIFTASGTESNNAIIKGVTKMAVGETIAVGGCEHPCVLCSARALADSWALAFVAVDECGLVDREDLQTILGNRCAIVSIMLANNETGVVQDIPALAQMVAAAASKTPSGYSRPIMHSDCAQAMGKIPLSFRDLGVDAMTISGHKFYAPKGVAALVVRQSVQWAPLFDGGGHESGYRSGTENVAGIVGFGLACELAHAQALRHRETARLRDAMEARLRAGNGADGDANNDVVIFGSGTPRLPNTSYFGFAGIDGETMVSLLDQSGFLVTSGAACSSMKDEPSHVLLAMGVDEATARTAVRCSLGAETTEAQVLQFADTCRAIATRVRSLQAVAS